MYYEIKDGPTWAILIPILILILIPLAKMFINSLQYARKIKEQNDQFITNEIDNQATESESDQMVFM